MNYFNFDGKVALIVGGGSGLGFEIAKALGLSGALVILSSRSMARLEKAQKSLLDIGLPDSQVKIIPSDIRDESSREELLEKVRAVAGERLDILVNSAGINIRSDLVNTKVDETEEVLQANLIGPIFVTKLFFEMLCNSDTPRVINIASIFATVSFPGRTNYSISKGGVLQFTKTLAAEWADQKITVNAISPGPFLTEINKQVLENKKNYDDFCKNIPLRRFGDPEEIVSSALFLASAHSSYVTGSNIVVDGGWTAT
jgi:NAD(P)-dependent dehydrogenase (short-subunit alcohol dehydrogenase family)